MGFGVLLYVAMGIPRLIAHEETRLVLYGFVLQVSRSHWDGLV